MTKSVAEYDQKVDLIIAKLNLQHGKRGISVLDQLERYQRPHYERYWVHNPQLYRWFAEQLIRTGSLTHALSVTRAGRSRFRSDPLLRLFEVVTLTRSGNLDQAEASLQRAERILRDEIAENSRFAADVYCQWGRVFQGRCIRERSSERSMPLAIQAANCFAQASAREPEWHYPMISNAVMRVAAGQFGFAEQLAKQTLDLANRNQANWRIKPPARQDELEWCEIAQCLANAILADENTARMHYDAASDGLRRRGEIGTLGSLHRDLEFLNRFNTRRLSLLDNHSVLAFAGHIVDQPNREKPRFPISDGLLESRLAEEIKQNLRTLRPIVAYCSLAAGSDIIFAEQVLRFPTRIELHVVLPFDFEVFLRRSVDFDQHPNYAHWRQRAEWIKNRPDVQVHYSTTESFLGSEDLLYSLANRYLQGLAIMHADELCVEPVALVVLEGQDSAPQRLGGTAYFLHHWRTRSGKDKKHFVQIDLSCVRNGDLVCTYDSHRSFQKQPVKSAKFITGNKLRRHEERSMLFADIEKYSQIPDKILPDVMTQFYSRVNDLLKQQGGKQLHYNTWGDAIYVVYEQPEEAADLAIKLHNSLKDQPIPLSETAGDSARELRVRIGLHHGPVHFWAENPNKKANNSKNEKSYCGQHISTAARVEPLATVGATYCTEQFAALLTTRAGQRFRCERVGVRRLPKKFGSARLFRIREEK